MVHLWKTNVGCDFKPVLDPVGVFGSNGPWRPRGREAGCVAEQQNPVGNGRRRLGARGDAIMGERSWDRFTEICSRLADATAHTTLQSQKQQAPGDPQLECRAAERPCNTYA